MNAVKLPTLLELMINRAATDKTADPLYQCKMGWCTQCSCNKSDLIKQFGAIEYKVEPKMLPVSDKVLPCISMQSKFALTMEQVSDLFHMQPNAKIVKKNVVVARSPKSDEIDTELRTLVCADGKIIVGARTLITTDSVIVRNPVALAPDKYTEMLVSKEKFLMNYGELPGAIFKEFSASKPIGGYLLTSDILEAWEADDDGCHYYRQGKDVFKVHVGTVITENGTAVTDEISLRLEIINDFEQLSNQYVASALSMG